MLRRPTQANAAKDPERLREASRLIDTVESGGEQIPESMRN
jgi:hypothetical protein